MRKKRALLNQGIVRRDTFWDKILAPIQGKLGGRVHTIVCGAAPLNPEEKVEYYFLRPLSLCPYYTKSFSIRRFLNCVSLRSEDKFLIFQKSAQNKLPLGNQATSRAYFVKIKSAKFQN